jgi:hypothetical protein
LSRVPIDELLQGLRKKSALIRAPLPQLVRYILRHVPRPSLCGIKTDNPNGALELAFQHVSDDGFKVGILDIGFAPAASSAAIVVLNKIGFMIDAWDDRRGLTHTQLQLVRKKDQAHLSGIGSRLVELGSFAER